MKAIILAVLATIVVGAYAVPTLQADFASYEAEGECIATLIAQGIERKDIVSGNGTCSIK